jgi:hypothetical protein
MLFECIFNINHYFEELSKANIVQNPAQAGFCIFRILDMELNAPEVGFFKIA